MYIILVSENRRIYTALPAALRSKSDLSPSAVMAVIICVLSCLFCSKAVCTKFVVRVGSDELQCGVVITIVMPGTKALICTDTVSMFSFVATKCPVKLIYRQWRI